MTKRYVCLSAVALLMLAAGTLGATSFRSDNVNIPFAFQVHGKTVPAGQYRIVQNFGSEVAALINLQTGERYMLSRPDSSATPHKARLVFENTEQGYKLKKIS